ncbi:hydrogenase maturation protease [Streptomyces racemochromogenes]|uniref:Hydrogenase maturation protease n=1 Tax=Streptomyces racemochromogenes TaxID=67353 RepID=A0ABW7P800_9ACTN
MTRPGRRPVRPSADRARRAAVIGIGNEFRRDDAVGWAAVGLLRERNQRRALPPDTVLAQCDGDPGRLLELWQDTGLVVVVDACTRPSPRPGRTHRWYGGPGAALGPSGPGRHSTHGLGLSEALRLGAALDRGPGRLVVYGVEGADHSWGLGMTPAVAAALPRLVRRIEADLVGYRTAAARARPVTVRPAATRRAAFGAPGARA